MSKAANTYWGNTQTTPNNGRSAHLKKGGRTAAKVKSSSPSQWVAIGIALGLTIMVCLTINFRAFSVLGTETAENATLNNRIQAVTSENLNLQEEIHYLKNDSSTIEREAKKFGLTRPKKEKVSVPTK